MYGLRQTDLEYIEAALSKYDEVEKAVIFGSRALGNYKRGSDIDLAVFGKNISERTLAFISLQLNEEDPLPYYFDILDYEKLYNEDLKKHIDEKGKVIYQQS
ncbi:nucleotidyltransferase domain-containing protein [Halobacillus fulvus]|nr:nucleotidyltransferase domain-containing protein [Halobacillus fulvus]